MEETSKAPDASRRGALKKIALGTGALTTLPILGQAAGTPGMGNEAMAAASAPPSAAADWKPLFFDAHQNETVIALTELIIPETDTPGAKAALVNRFLDLWLNEEEADRQKFFLEGLAWIDGRSIELYGKPFVDLSNEQQTRLLTPLADPDNRKPEDQPGVRFFDELKGMTIFGYYSSKIGLEQELQYGGDDYHTEFPGACNHPEHLN
jgi:hypothetical protein